MTRPLSSTSPLAVTVSAAEHPFSVMKIAFGCQSWLASRDAQRMLSGPIVSQELAMCGKSAGGGTTWYPVEVASARM